MYPEHMLPLFHLLQKKVKTEVKGLLKHKPSVRQVFVEDSSDTNHPKKAMLRAVKYDEAKRLEKRIM